MSKYNREKKSFITNSASSIIEFPNETYDANPTLLEKLPEWLRNFKTNFDTIGFQRHIGDLPKIKGPALIVDHPFSGSLEKHLATLQKYEGTIFCCDRALYKILPHKIPTYVVNVDSSYLCMSFFDRPDVREHMKDITAIFSAMTFPLTIRNWHGKRVFFIPYLGDELTHSLMATSKLPYLAAGGCVHNTCYVLAYALGANPIGLLGIENSYDDLSQTEYPDVHHEKIETQFGIRYSDPVYLHYARIMIDWSELFYNNSKVQTFNCTQNGITYGEHIHEMSLESFIADFC